MTVDPFEMLAEVVRTRQEPWRQDAACRGLPVSWFYPEQGKSPDPRAKRTCEQCPVRDACWADGRLESYGYWSGQPARYRPRQKPINHGTRGGYQSHIRRGEEACSDCKRAHSVAVQISKGRPVESTSHAVMNHPDMIGPARRWRHARDEDVA